MLKLNYLVTVMHHFWYKSFVCFTNVKPICLNFHRLASTSVVGFEVSGGEVSETHSNYCELFRRELFAEMHFLTFSLFASKVNCNSASEWTAIQKKIMTYIFQISRNMFKIYYLRYNAHANWSIGPLQLSHHVTYY